MEENNKSETYKKWESIIDEMGLTNSQSDWMNKYICGIDNSTKENSILPMVMRVAAKTLSSDLHFATKEEIEEVEKRIISENRDGKIESIIDDKEFKEKRLEDDEEYKKLMNKGVKPMSAPTGQLFYLDFKYELNQDFSEGLNDLFLSKVNSNPSKKRF
jgi:DNA-binding TFAR19-related protein (PDSD5 family)